ncbi:MAG: efflux RND transporter permease subunit [bacterium]
MIEALIRWSIKHRILVILLTIIVSILGIEAVITRPVDALPDLSDVQVIIHTRYEGQAPQIIEDQITYPISTALLAVPGSQSVRGYSFYGDSYVYVIFKDGTDLYWARSRVLEYLNQVNRQLPPGVQPELGPDATGTGWIYEYALIDRTGKHDLSELTSIQNWLLKYELQSVEGVAEIATVGGMVKQYQVIIDPDKLRGYYLTMDNVKKAIQNGSHETGGSTLELAEAEYMIRFKGYIQNKDDIGLISVPTLRRRLSISSVVLDDITQEIRLGPAMRRGVAELDGEGEVVGGIVVMRQGSNPRQTITSLKAKIDSIKTQLPDGVEIIETYNRSTLIERSIDTLNQRLIEEFLVLIAVCMLFLWHFRSSLVVLFSLPVGLLIAFLLMKWQGINANIMSLGGIAIAIGTMMDAGIVMIENVHKHIERENHNGLNRIESITRAAIEVGPALFFSLLIITLSFVPVFALEAQEYRLFSPLAFTKTWSMAASALLSITLIPAIMVFLIKGKIPEEQSNPVNRWLIRAYKPIIQRILNKPAMVLTFVLAFAISSLYPILNMGQEFMPELDEGDLLYMPTTLPGISIGKARELLQQTDRMIKTVPEVQRVFGKVGRAETATDPAPLNMIETTIKLKPKNEWRPGMTMEKIRDELDQTVTIPSVSNAWLMPIKTRIDMQNTGINTPVGIKISGPDVKVLQQLGKQIETILKPLPGTRSVIADRTDGGRYLDIEIDRLSAAHYGLSIKEIEDAANMAIAGQNLAYSVEGREYYPVNLRYPRSTRNSISKLKQLPIIATEDIVVQLQDLASIKVVDGPAILKSENGRLNGWVYITTQDDDISGYIANANQAINQQLQLPAGYTLTWTGQYQYLQRTLNRLQFIVPLTILIILTLLYMSFQRLDESLIVLCSVPLSMIGGIWLVYLLGYHFSVAVAVGFIALAGVSAEFAVVMMIYLKQAIQANPENDPSRLVQSIIKGAVLRVRPKAMTISVIVFGLLPIMLGNGSGSEVMRRIAAPMIGGMLTAPLVSMLIIPVLYYQLIKFKQNKENQ